MLLIGREFSVGGAVLRGVKYCDPCQRPAKLAKKGSFDFAKAFHDRGGLVAEVVMGGVIKVNSLIITPDKGY